MRFAAVVALAALTLLSAVVALVAPTACAPLPPRRSAATPTTTEARIQRPPPNAPPDPIGTTRPGDRSCTETRDCKAGDICFAPDYTPPTVAAAPCQQDSQCPSGDVCSTGTCTPPCTATSSSPGHTCRDGRCTPTPCTDPQAAICPQNFRCTPTSGACERQPCTSRSQCDSGVCFHGQCFAHDAYCAPPTATPPQPLPPKPDNV
jgi:Cys-rich repeat protein